MILGLFLTVRMDVSKKYVIAQFFSVIPVHATYFAMHWFEAVNKMIHPLYCFVVPIFGGRVFWHAT